MDQSPEQTHATLSAFFVAMSLYAEVEQKARDELEAIVGASWLPNRVDRERPPYVDAVVKEALRRHCGTPLLNLHFSTVLGPESSIETLGCNNTNRLSIYFGFLAGMLS